METRQGTGFETALNEWCEALGAENVITDSQSLRASATATFRTSQTIPAILRPATREEVQECVRIAAAHSAPIYPISSGFNWGYGSRVPVSQGCALLDLRRMDRILDFSEDLAYVTVEPGVTQGQLLAFLEERGSRLWLDATGSTPQSSLIGNTVERGFGHTPYGDHFANCCGLEVILPNGECVETGFSRFSNARAGSLYRWGVGPTIDGLFSQSNLGIVTRMTIWLMPAPEYFQAYFFRCDEDSGLERLIDGLRPLRLNNTIRSASHIGNDYKVLSSLHQYPWNETGGQTPLQPHQMKEFRRKLKFGAWNGSGGLYGTKAQVAEARRLLKTSLSGAVNRLEFLDANKIEFASKFAKLYQLLTGWDLTRTLELVRPVFGLMKGLPTDSPLKSTYWRKRMAIPSDMDPDRDGCGLLWCAPVAPIVGSEARAVCRLANEILLSHGFEPMISLTLITERALACIITIAYDRSIEGEDEKAMKCYRELLAKLSEGGYQSYRLGIQSMSEMDGNTGYNRLLQTVKQAVDPQHILSPGRYEPRCSV